MKIAWLCPEMMHPPNTGGRLLLYHRLKSTFEAGHEIYLFITYKGGFDEASVDHLRGLSSDLFLFDRDSTKAASAFRSLAQMLPYAATNRFFPEINKRINDIDPDLVIVEFPQMLDNLTPATCAKYPVVLEQHNIEWRVSASLAKGVKKNIVKRYLYEREARLLKAYESRICNDRKVTLMTFVTQNDLEACDSATNVPRKAFIPGATDFFTERIEASKNITFVANYSYIPNVNAAIWFAREVLPLVWRDVPDAEFWMVGKKPPAKIDALAKADSRIHVTGVVDNLKPYYCQTEVVVLPIVEGGGVKMKALEASSANRTIVSTSFSLVGTGIEAGIHARVADDADKFATDVVGALQHPERYEGMRRACRRLYEEELSWDVANRRWMECVLQYARDSRDDGGVNGR